ncbi:hypothetical protein GCM10011325_05980 [Dyadobacter sediminis]|nr:hypothetical protein GCM10011325_05980 [Dyadobacter sediminis]
MVANYDKAVKEHILFMEFDIRTGAKGRQEKVKLVRAVAGNGRTKGLNSPVHGPYRIMMVPRYRSNALEKEFYYEHPLFRSVEVASPGGTLSKASIAAKQGMLSVRIQENADLDRIELFSLTPDKGTTKIYTVYFQP